MTSDGMAPVPAGWYRDPSGGSMERYYDGTSWSAETRPLELRRRNRQPARTVEATVATLPAEETRGQAQATLAPTVSAFGLNSSGMPTLPPVGEVPRPGSGERRSLTDALSSPVSGQSAQSLLLGTAGALAPRSLRTGVNGPASGWYPDPARTGNLRFFDGARWTSRTRPPADQGLRRLPQAALRLRAAFIEAQDAAALRRGDKPAAKSVAIPHESAAPSLRMRTHKAGSVLAMVSTMLIVVGLAAAALFTWELWGSDYYNTYQQRDLEQNLAAEPSADWVQPVVVPDAVQPTAGETNPTPAPAEVGTPTPSTKPPSTSRPHSTPPTPPASTQPKTSSVKVTPPHNEDGRPVGTIRIPAINMKRVFVLGTDAAQLAEGPGLWKWGAFPGTPGNTTLSGHRTTHGAPFRYLNELNKGDKIYIDVPGQEEAVYEVRGHTIASPFNVGITKQTAGVRLTMTTCDPVGSAKQRLVIESELVSGKYADQALPDSEWKLIR